MTGTLPSVKVTLRNLIYAPKAGLEKGDKISYTIVPFDNPLARDWVTALKAQLYNCTLEKSFCWIGFPYTFRSIGYLCSQLNQTVGTINRFNHTQQWRDAGLKPYYIEDWYSDETVRWQKEYGVGEGYELIGFKAKHQMLNRLHNHFEKLQGTVEQLSPYYAYADNDTKFAIRQLNNLCHELEGQILTQRKLQVAPQWVRPSQITSFINATRYLLKPEHRELFVENGFDRKFGHVYMHWAQIGKTLYEVYRDEGAPNLAETTCEAITHLKYYTGEFDVEWGRDVTYDPECFWHVKEQDEFRAWLIKNNLDPKDPELSLGYLPLGKVDLLGSFGTEDIEEIWKILGNHLDIVAIECDDAKAEFNYKMGDMNLIKDKLYK